MIKIKICGITNLTDGLVCQNLGVDYIGFVFAPSPRRVSPAAAAGIAGALKGKGPELAGVFVNEKEDVIKKTADLCSLDVIQLHGEEPASFCGKFAGRKVFKAFRVKNENDLHAMEDYRVDALLVDSFVRGKHGGTGKTLSLELAAKAAALGKNIILSGGLSPENVGSYIDAIDFFGVDVSSGVEAGPGRKDENKIKRFVNAVRGGGND